MGFEDKTSCRGYQVTQPYVCGYVCMYVLQNVHRYGTTGYVHVIITDSGDHSDSFTILNCITNAYVTVMAIMLTSFTVLYLASVIQVLEHILL